MSEPTPVPPNPTTEPAPVASAPQAPQPPQQGGFRGPPRAGQRGEPRGRERFPKGERPKAVGSKPPELAHRDFAALRPNRRDLDQGIEDEMAAALAGFDVTGTVAKEEARPGQQPLPGQSAKKKGTVVGIHGKDVFVDVPGGRGQGVIQLMQFEDKPPQVGDVIEFAIEGYDGANGLLKLTMSGSAQVVTDWSSVSRGMVVEAKITGVNKNKTGLLVEVNGIKAFMPASLVDMYRTENIEALVGQKMKVEVVEVDPAERNLIVSRRALLERERMQLAEEFWAKIEEGQVKRGTVKTVKPFGAFVDLGGADGLIPVSELSWSRVGDPSEIVQVGQQVEVVVHRVDRDARKIGLSLRQLVRSPWNDFADEHKAGARITGKVTRLMDFGAFVEVAPGIEGLVHVSELSTQRVRRVRDVLQEGQMVEVQVQSVDPGARRMSLSLKAMKAEAEAAEVAKTAEEEAADRKEADERMAARKANPNLRGGIGGGKLWWEQED